MTLRHRWEQRYSSTVSLTFALNEVCGQRYVPSAVPSGKKTPVTHCTRGCVGLEANLEGCGKSQPEFETLTVHPVANRYTDCVILAATKRLMSHTIAYQ